MPNTEGLPSLGDCASFIKRLGKPTAADVLREAHRTKRVAVQPRSGVGDHGEMLRLLGRIENEAGPDILTLTIDSYSRLGKFRKAEELIRTNTAALNGYPLVAHGWRKGRELNLRTKAPLDIRHGSPIARTLFDVAIASGITSFEGGGITYNLPYAKKVPLAESLAAWRDIDRICGELTENGIIVAREMFGTLTAVLVPPSISLTITFLEAVSAAQEGVRCIEIAYPQGGNTIQDIAALKSITVLADRYLPFNVTVYPVLHQYMGPFPRDPAKARALILLGGIIARLGGAAKVVTKTYNEAHGIPTTEANVDGILMTKCSLSSLFEDLGPDQQAVREEAHWIQREVAELIEPVLSNSHLDKAITESFTEGRLDIPFSPSLQARGQLMPIRDRSGAIRYLSRGKLPFTKPTRDRNDRLLLVASDVHAQVQKIVDDVHYFTDRSSIYSGPSTSPLLHNEGPGQEV